MDVPGLRPICSWKRLLRRFEAAVRQTAEVCIQTRHIGQREVAAADIHHTESHKESFALEGTIEVRLSIGDYIAKAFQPLQMRSD